ncbi:hypothetical protein GGR34_001750 [Microvirga flocculans]|uniref:Right-handed parallel beta-helix repeat-containing protein n=1 Tax=Microvirga flocculans TaxID=217168 RepID=A0A7W6IER8_9HYPH|nr:hypothetical protein [Microvirga flocculans]MBB4040099.1 hypothetical protein [Microvirga flocculans]
MVGNSGATEAVFENADNVEAEAVFSARVNAIATYISASVQVVRLLGYATAGDGGAAIYTRLNYAPTQAKAWHFQSADGAWWQLAERKIHAQMMGVRADGVLIYGGSITAGQTALSVTGASFSADDIGKVIVINGAGASGGYLTTTIASYISATVVQLNVAASTTVSNTRVIYGTDDTIAMQSTVDVAFAHGGGEVELPSGFILMRSMVTFDSRAYTIDVALNPTVNLRGQGSGATRFLYLATNDNPMFYYIGTVAGGGIGVIRLLNWSGFSIYAVYSGVGSGIKFQLSSGMRVSDVHIREFKFNLLIEDSFSATFERCSISFGNRGIWAYRSNFAGPNALTFIGCNIGGQSEWGAMFDQGAAITFTGGSFEGCGAGGSGSRGGIWINNPSLEGGNALTCENVYFENNSGLADIIIQSGANGRTVANLRSMHNRTSNSGATNCIVADASFGGSIVLNVDGTAVRIYGAYTPSSTRPVIRKVGPVRQIGTISYSSPLEAPEAANSSPLASCVFNTTGSTGRKTPLRSNNISSINKLSKGNFSVEYQLGGSGRHPFLRHTSNQPIFVYLTAYTDTSINIGVVDRFGDAYDPDYLGLEIVD